MTQQRHKNTIWWKHIYISVRYMQFIFFTRRSTLAICTFILFIYFFLLCSSCRTSHILCARSLLFPPFLSLHLINNTVLATLAFLWFLWSWHALAWSRLPLAPWAWRRVQPRPSFAYNSLCGCCYISSVSSEGYKDSASTLQCSPARFTL